MMRMAGANGLGASNHFAQCRVTPNQTLLAAAADTLVAPHTIYNDGNFSARVEMSAAWGCPEPITPA